MKADQSPSQVYLQDAAALIGALFNNEPGSHPTIEKFLKWIAQRMDAFGCALWEISEGSDITSDPPRGHCFIAAAWMDAKDFFAMHDAPLRTTAIGSVFVTQQPKKLDDLAQEGGSRRNHPFFVKYDVACLLSAPVPGGRWCLTLYRQRNDAKGIFTEEDMVRLTHIAALLPGLYQAVIDHTRLHLHHDITEVIRVSVPTKGRTASRAEMDTMMRGICSSVGELFHCAEASIFLEDPRQGIGVFENVASTWPAVVTQKSYTISDADRCMTGWVLKNKQSLRITNLFRFQPQCPDDYQRIRNEFCGLEWMNHEHLKSQMLARLAIESEQELPPASFLCVPILHGNELLGVLRCCLSQSAPLYFSRLEQESLEHVAAIIGQSWSAWLSQRETDSENQCWREVVSSIRQLNGFVVKKLRETPDEKEILEESLRLTEKVFPDAPFNSVRLANESEDKLTFAAFLPVRSWDELKQKEFAKKLSAIEMPIKQDASVGANVFISKREFTLTDESSLLYQRLYDDAGVRWLHFEPILVGDQCYGVLDIRGSGPEKSEPFIPLHFYPVMKLLACQIGLYHNLARMKKREERFLAQQKSVYEDLAHQLKGPIAFANRWAGQSLHLLGWSPHRNAFEEPDLPDNTMVKKLSKSLIAVRGLCRKARRVTSSLGILAADQDHTPLSPDLRVGSYDRLVRLLVEAAQDTERMVDAARNIKFEVNRQTLSEADIHEGRFDYDLTEQAIGNLLDNAAKYGYPNSIVNVFASVDRSKFEFSLCVTNRGIRMSPDDVKNCRKKHYRSVAAKAATGEGVGVGLYIVDKIMHAHGGRLDIDPCNLDGLTEFRLVYPIQS